jgi:hypothetical protein
MPPRSGATAGSLSLCWCLKYSDLVAKEVITCIFGKTYDNAAPWKVAIYFRLPHFSQQASQPNNLFPRRLKLVFDEQIEYVGVIDHTFDCPFVTTCGGHPALKIRLIEPTCQ